MQYSPAATLSLELRSNQCRFFLIVCFAIIFTTTSYSQQTYHVSTVGNDTTGNGSIAQPWRTLKHACLQVPADQGHTIQLGAGTHLDAGRLSPTNVPATLRRNVNLVGAGVATTIYRGQINVPLVFNQTIRDFRLDGSENMSAAQMLFQGLLIDTGSGLIVRDMRIEGFHSNGLRFGLWSGLSNSKLHDCHLINNGAHNTRAFGMRTGDLNNVEIHNNVFLEERGKGGEPWNTGLRIFTNVKIYNNHFTTHNDTAAGWNGQQPFNFELWQVDCLNVEIFNNRFDGSISLTEHLTPRQNKTPFGVRIYNNDWESRVSGYKSHNINCLADTAS
jgi:hypothetical protein